MVEYPFVYRRVILFHSEAHTHFNQRIIHFATYFSIDHCQKLPSVTIPFGTIYFFYTTVTCDALQMDYNLLFFLILIVLSVFVFYQAKIDSSNDFIALNSVALAKHKGSFT